MTREQLRRDIRHRLDASGHSMRHFAVLHDVTVSHLCAFLKHGGKPTLSIVTALGYRRIQPIETYEKT